MLESLANRGFEPISFPKSTSSNSPKLSCHHFGDCFWGLMRDVPTGEDYQHEKEEFQGTM